VDIDYHLAQQYPFPTPFNDAYGAYEWTTAHASEFGGDSKKVILAGASAGGNLTAAAALRAHNVVHNNIVGMILVYSIA
jgi:acetyl esterase